MSSISFEQLERLVATAQTGSYAAAGKATNVTPQAVAQSVSSLEKTLHIKLFVKVGRNIAPTLHASALIKKAEELVSGSKDLKNYADALAVNEGDARNITGSLSIAIPSSPYEGEAIPRKYLLGFQKKYPRIDLSFTYRSGGYCLVLFEEGVVDLLITRGRYPREGFLSTKLFDAPLYAVVSKTHPLASKQDVSLQDLSGYSMSDPYDLGFCHTSVEEAFEKKELGRILAKPMIFADEYDSFIHKELGIGFAIRGPRMENHYPDIVFLPLEGGNAIEIPICVTTRQHSRELALLQQYLLTISE